MKIPLVDLHAQYISIKSEIDEAIASVIEHTSFIGGKHVTDFEKNFAAYTGAKYAVGCANGTDSLEILLKAMGVGLGDEVIVPANSWISTSEAVSNIGATPIFVDVDVDYFCINADLIESKISERTKVIMPVHLYGQPANMIRIKEIADKYRLRIIEDSAQAHGARIGKYKVGDLSDAASYSFFPGKNLGAYGDAGGITTNNKEIAEKAQLIGRHGQKIRHQHIIEGRNSRLDALQAAILNVKLPYLEKWTEARIKNAALYDKYLENVNVIRPKVKSDVRHVYHLYVIKTDKREELQTYLKESGIETSVHYPTTLPLLPCYSSLGFQPSDFPIAFGNQNKILSLPMYAELSEEKIERIAQKIKDVVN